MSLQELESKYFLNTYNRIPLEIDRGEGVYLYTKDGKRYLDMFGGLAVNALGYNHPKILRAIVEQSRKYIHLSNYYLQEPQIRLAELLVKYSGYPKVFLSNSGTEAIEGAIKIARKWGKANGKSEIVAFTNAFHGRTLGSLSIMDRKKYREGYDPFLSHCNVVPFNNPEALRKTIDRQTSAVFIEFIEGEGGIVPATSEFIETLRSLKEQYGFLIVADEIQSGLGRTGKFFSFRHYTIEPDIVVVAKALGGGLPLGAILGNNTVAGIFQPGDHGSTFGGNPVACAAGAIVLDELMNNGVMTNAGRMGAFLKSNLENLKNEFPAIVKEVRGMGLMIGMELTLECGPIVTALRGRNILLNCTNKNVLRFLPPLVIDQNHIKITIDEIRSIFSSP